MYYPLLSPGALAFGLASAALPPYVPNGYFEELTNLEPYGGGLRVRRGITAITGTGLGTGTHKGEYHCVLNGTSRLFQAIYQSDSKTHVYESTDMGATWTEITATTGPYRDTTFSTSNRVAFTVVRDRARLGIDAKDCLVFSDGTSLRVYAPAVESGSGASVGTNIVSAPPSEIALPDIDDTDTFLWPNFGAGLNVANGTKWTFTAFESDGTTVQSDLELSRTTTSTTDNVLKLTIKTTVGTDDFTVATCADAVDFSDAKQIVLLLGSSVWSDWENVRIDVGGFTVKPEGSTLPEDAVYVRTSTGEFQYGILIPKDAASNLDSVATIRATWKGTSAPSAQKELYIYVVCRSGNYLGTHRFAASFYNSDSRQIGPAAEIDLYRQPSVTNSGGTAIGSIVGFPTMLYDASFYFDYNVRLGVPASSQANQGVNKALVHVLKPGQTEFYYAFGIDVASYRSTLAITGATNAAPIVVTTASHGLADGQLVRISGVLGNTAANGEFYVDVLSTTTFALYSDSALTTSVAGNGAYTSGGNVAGWRLASLSQVQGDYTGQDQDFNWPIPPDDVIPTPAGSCLASTGDRLLIGSDSGVYFSRTLRPFLFALTSTPEDDESSGEVGIDGESAKAIVPVGRAGNQGDGVGTANQSVNTFLIVTDRTLRLVSGFTTLAMSKSSVIYQEGTESPGAVCGAKSGVFYLTGDRRLVWFDGASVRVIGDALVDDRLEDIPGARIANAHASFFRERLYLAYTASGSTNAKVLVFDPQASGRMGREIFYEVSESGVDFEALLPLVDSGTEKLLAFTKTGSLYRMEDPGNSTAVAIAATFRELTGEGVSGLSIERIRATCQAGTSLTFALTSRDANATTESLTLSLSGSGRIVRYAASGPTVQGDAVSIRMTGSLAPGWELYEVLAEASKTDDLADS